MLASAENALLTAMKQHRDCRRLVKTIDGLPVASSGSDLLRRFVADAPAMYVTPGQFSVRDDSMVMMFTVWAIARNAAGYALARKGDGVTIGLDGLFVLAMRSLHNQNLAGSTWKMTRGEMDDDAAYGDNGLAVLEMAFESAPIELAYDYGEEQLDELDDLRTVHADLDLAPMASTSERAKWVHEPADYTTDRPNLQADIQLNGGS